MKMLFKFKPCDHQVVALPGSKSISNRALLLAALAQGQSTLRGFLLSDDSRAFAKALQDLGVDIQIEGTTVIVDGQGEFPNKKAKVWCQDAGTAARFLCAACATTPGEFELDGTQRLRERPLKPLIEALKTLGATFSDEQMPCVIQGKSLEGGEIVLNSGASSQFVSALLMVAPLLKYGLKLTAKGLNRDAYIKLTCDMMSEFGVTVKSKSFEYSVKRKQHYHAVDYQIEPDLSSASYFFAKAAVTGSTVLVKDIDRQSCKQGDIQFLNVLELMGCSVVQMPEGIQVTGSRSLMGVDVNMNNFSDPFMTLACIAPFAESPTTITGLAHTRLQESDRISAISEELQKLDVAVETGDDWIRIFPSEVKPALVHSHHDHRVAMSLAVVGSRIDGIECEDAEAVSKTFPDFFGVF